MGKLVFESEPDALFEHDMQIVMLEKLFQSCHFGEC